MDEITIEYVEETIDLAFDEPPDIILEFDEVGPQGLPGLIQAVIAGDNIQVDDSDPAYPIVSTSDDLVSSVNGETGVVVLSAVDVGADSVGSASSALSSANAYTDNEIAGLSFVESVVAGDNVTIDDSDPQNPVISSSGGGSGDVASVNGLTGIVVLDQDDIADGTTYKQYSLTEKTKLAGIQAGAEVNVNADWNAVSGDAQILNKPTIPSIANLFNKTTDDSDDIVQGSTNLFLTGGERTKLSNTSGVNTGDQDLSGLVPKSTTVNGHALSANVTVTKSDVGLSNADNTSDLAKPVSTATQTALNLKQDTLVSGTNIKTINGATILGAGDLEIDVANGIDWTLIAIMSGL